MARARLSVYVGGELIGMGGSWVWQRGGVESLDRYSNVGTPVLVYTVWRLPLDTPKEPMERCVWEGVDESLKDVRELHESLKAKREVLISRKAEAEFVFQMAAAGSGFAPDVK